MNQDVLFPELGHPPEKPRINKYKGYPALPGTGPEGETCRTCEHKTIKPGMAGHYLKCEIMREHWTGGEGTDIKAKSPACRKWEKKDA